MRNTALASVMLLCAIFISHGLAAAADALTEETQVYALINRMRADRRLPPLSQDPILCAVARSHSEDMRNGGYLSYSSPRLGDIAYAVRRAGISATRLRYQIFQASSSRQLQDLLPTKDGTILLGPETHVGIGVAESARPPACYMTLIVIRRQTTLNPFPTLVKPDETRRLSGNLLAGLRAPRIGVTYPSPQGAPNVLEIPVVVDENGDFEAEITFDRGPGEYTIEIEAEGALGPEVTDIMKVYAGAPYPPPAAPEPDEKQVDLSQAREIMLKLINDDRARSGLGPLVSDDALAAVARAHCLDMVRNNFFAHVSPTTGDLSARLKAAGIMLRTYAENIAMDRSVRKAHEGLMESPLHRKNLLSVDFERVGIGIVPDESGLLYVTQDFGQAFPTYDPRLCEDALMSEINLYRGNAPLRRDAALDRIAAENSKAMRGVGKPGTDAAIGLLKKELPRAASLTLVLMSSDRPSAALMKLPDQTSIRKFDRVGVAVLSATAAGRPPLLWTTVILAAD